ncbi:uncharacterized protein LOC131155031 isoform X2 [Malania oleifera]|uniref:uncharacterized protein LOC131155031 isoform X2 n=1 Tax=Malania oleifera TaxID=397392 RepID=UPI0025AEA7B5|nr:uncharacterized protein LOC131155031 isoform X2 [Malania oleifera]
MRICSGWRQLLLLLALIFFLSHLFSGVLELQQSSTVEDIHKKHSKKFDHLVLGPAAGQGLHDRLQCQGVKALNKTHFSTSSRISYSAESISFVTVFAVYNSSLNMHVDGRSSTLVAVGNATYNKVERSMAVLNVFINYIQAFLEARLEELSKGWGHANHYIFTDSDIAVVDDLGQIFHDYPNFHVALTFRNNKDQPLNSGFIAVRGTADGILRAKIFLRKVLKVYSSKYMNASRMLGDQLALAWIVKSHPSFDARRFVRPRAFVEEIDGASVLFLPCAIYNWTPPEGAGQFHGMPLDVKVVHFKGSRKRLMLESWNFFSSSFDISDTLCLILKSGRMKYDF